MSLRMQALLLRFLENGEIQSVGADHSELRPSTSASSRRPIATSPDMVAGGQFREDLLYRLRVIHLHVPPLRERKRGHPRAGRLFAAKRAARPSTFTDEALRTARALSLARQRPRAPERRRAARSGWRTGGRSKSTHLPPSVQAAADQVLPMNASAASRSPTSCTTRSSAAATRSGSTSTRCSCRATSRGTTFASWSARAAHDARQLSVAASAVRHAGVGLQALPELPGGPRLQRGLQGVSQWHRAGRAHAGAAAAAAARRSARAGGR